MADDVEIGPFTMVGTSRLERGAHAGPFARLRMENHVAEGAHIGNFVELKKTRLGAGAKAMHLAYLGDSQIGAKVNIGAGTITCNYDGVRKHPDTDRRRARSSAAIPRWWRRWKWAQAPIWRPGR